MTFFYILVLYLMKYNIYFIVCVNPLPLFTSHLRLVCCMAYFYILLCICYYLSHLSNFTIIFIFRFVYFIYFVKYVIFVFCTDLKHRCNISLLQTPRSFNKQYIYIVCVLFDGYLSYLLSLFPNVYSSKKQNQYINYIYSKPYCRIQPYLVGFILGYFIYKKCGEGRRPGWVSCSLLLITI